MCVSVWLQYLDSSSYLVGRGAKFLSLHLKVRHMHNTPACKHTLFAPFSLSLFSTNTLLEVRLFLGQTFSVHVCMCVPVHVFMLMHVWLKYVFIQAENPRDNRALRLQEQRVGKGP